MKTILITGASSGFGLATAKLIAKDNRLILLARRRDKLDELKDSLGANVHVANVDVTNQQQVQDFFASLPAEYRNIDVLVNAAGLALGMEPAQDSSLKDWEQMVDTNIKGLLRVTRPTLDIMKQRGRGLIINVGSVAATIPYKGGNVYGATKAFVRQFSRNLRTDLFGTGLKLRILNRARPKRSFLLCVSKIRKRPMIITKGGTPSLPRMWPARLLGLLSSPST